MRIGVRGGWDCITRSSGIRDPIDHRNDSLDLWIGGYWIRSLCTPSISYPETKMSNMYDEPKYSISVYDAHSCEERKK